MKYVAVHAYGNYIDAHIAKGQLEEEGIACWLKDEHLVSTMPIWTQAVGGIKLMVPESDLERTREVLQSLETAKQQNTVCPKCNSHNVTFVSTPRKVSNWLSVLLGFFVLSYAMPVDKVYHCFDCGHEFPADEN